MSRTVKTLPLGSLATDLSSQQQTMILLLALLSSLSPTVAARYRSRPVVSKVESGSELNGRESTALITLNGALLKELNKHCPPFSYVGRHPTQADHLGVWVDLDALHRAESSGQITQAPIESRGLRSPFVLDFSGTGLTLYRRRGKKVLWRAA